MDPSGPIEQITTVDAEADRARRIFDGSDACLWLEDFSGALSALNDLRRSGVEDLRGLLVQDEDLVWDIVGRIQVLDVNDATLRLFRAGSREELLGSLYRIGSLVGVDVMIEELVAIWEGKKRFQAEVSQVNLVGEELIVLVSIPFPEKAENFSNVVVSVLDVTEHRAVERALVHSENRFRDIASIASDWFFELDQNLRVSYLSDGWADALGFDPARLLGKSVQDGDGLTSEITGARTIVRWFELRREFRDEECGYILTDGSRIWISVSGKPIYDEQGRFNGYRGTGRDITPDVLAREDLAAAKQKAEQASHAKSLFLSSMSHELRTPLNVVLGFADLLWIDHDTVLNEDQKIAVEQIRRSGRKLQKMIDDILELSSIELGSVVMSNAHLQPREIVESSLLLISSAAKASKIELIDETGPEHLPLVYADPLRVRQVLVNLLSNGVKYNHPSGTVSLSASVATEGFVRFSVRDTGPGIPEPKQSELFRAFDRLGAESSGIEGTGIGLFVCKTLVDLMGGMIAAETSRDGSTFWIELPTIDAETQSLSLMSQGEHPSAAMGAELATKTVLYLDKDDSNRDLIGKLIQRLPNVRISFVRGVREGIACMDSEIPDLVLLDIELSNSAECNVYKYIRSKPNLFNIPVVAVIDHDDSGAMKKFESAGFADYLIKPYMASTVLDVITDLLDLNNVEY